MYHALIIEDEYLIAEHLRELVELVGATSVANARTEKEAVISAHEHAPDIILANVRLFEGTGIGAVATIRSSLGNIPVIFVTGLPDACKNVESPLVILQKPVDLSSVTEAFRLLVPMKSKSQKETGT